MGKVSDEVRSIGAYVRAVVKYWWLIVVGAGLTVLDFAERLMGTWWIVPRPTWLVVGIACVIVAQYLAYRDRRTQNERHVSDREISLMVTNEALSEAASRLENEIASLKEQNVKLKVKPYDETQRQLVQSKLKGYSDVEQDLLRLLMHRGETEGSLIYKAAQDGHDVCARTLERLGVDGMILMREDMSQANIWRPRFYRVNPHFDPVLRDLLYPRHSHASPRFVI